MRKMLMFALVAWFAVSACGLTDRVLGGGTVEEAQSAEPSAPAAPLESPSDATGQNDAGSGKDAGNDEPSALILEPGAEYRGLVATSDDPLDVYRVRSAPFEIVSVTVTADASNREPLNVYMQNTSGEYSFNYDILPGSSNTLVLAANQEQFNTIYFSAWDVAGYTFDVVVEAENDANTGGDVSGLIGEALPIVPGQEIGGTSVRLVGQGGHDQDCYALDFAETGALRVLLTSPTGQPYPESFARIELYRSNGDYIWGTSTSAGGSETLEAAIETTGRYVLCASTYEYYPLGFYTFVATLNP